MSQDNETPLFKLFKTKPDYSFFKIFGCACYPLLTPFNRHKFQFKSFECLFLGYRPQHKGYKCKDRSSKIYISKDVIFDENSFPYSQWKDKTKSHIQKKL